METDQIITQDCIPILANMPDQTADVTITDPPKGTGLYPQPLIDGIAALYLAAKKTKKHVIFFWSPVTAPPNPPPGWFHTATNIWAIPDSKTSIKYESIHVWTKGDYRRQPFKTWVLPILDYRSLHEWSKTHPTQKPLRLLRYLIQDFTKDGDLVLDPFAGTGTTGVAAKQLGRHYLLIEANKEYADFAQQRLQAAGPKDKQTTLDQEDQPPTLPPNTSGRSANKRRGRTQ